MARYDSRYEHRKNRGHTHAHVMKFDEDEVRKVLSGQLTQIYRPIWKHYHFEGIYECRTNPFYRSTRFALIKITGLKKIQHAWRIRFTLVKD